MTFSPEQTGYYPLVVFAWFEAILWIDGVVQTSVQFQPEIFTLHELELYLESGQTYDITVGQQYPTVMDDPGTWYSISIGEPCLTQACDGVFCGPDGCGGTCGCASGLCDLGQATCVVTQSGDPADPFEILEVPYVALGDTSSASDDPLLWTFACVPGVVLAPGAGDHAYRFTPAQTGRYTIHIEAAFESQLVLSQDSPFGPVCRLSRQGSGSVTVVLEAGVTYFLVVDGGPVGSKTEGTYELRIDEPCVPQPCDGVTCGWDGCTTVCECACGACDVNTHTCLALGGSGDSCGDAFVVTQVPFAATARTGDASEPLPPGVSCPLPSGSVDIPSGKEQFYRLTPSESGTHVISVVSVHGAVQAYVLTGCGGAGSSCLGATVPGGEVALTLTAGTDYVVVVKNQGNIGRRYTLLIDR